MVISWYSFCQSCSLMVLLEDFSFRKLGFSLVAEGENKERTLGKRETEIK